MAMTAQTSVVRTVSFSAAAIAASVAIPFIVHLVPGGDSIGATLLPIFWAPLLAVLFLGPVPGIAAAVLAPYLNHVLTGMPPSFVLPSLTLELGIFVAVIVLVSRNEKAKHIPLLAPVAYLVARVITGLVLTQTDSIAQSAAIVFGNLGAAWPGIACLLVLNIFGVLVVKRTTKA